MARNVRKPYARLVTTRILLFRPSTAPLDTSPLARNQFSVTVRRNRVGPRARRVAAGGERPG